GRGSEHRFRDVEVVGVAVVEGDGDTGAGCGTQHVSERHDLRATGQVLDLRGEVIGRHRELVRVAPARRDRVVHQDGGRAVAEEVHTGPRLTTHPHATTGCSGSWWSSSLGRSSSAATPMRSAVAARTLPNPSTSTSPSGHLNSRISWSPAGNIRHVSTPRPESVRSTARTVGTLTSSAPPRATLRHAFETATSRFVTRVSTWTSSTQSKAASGKDPASARSTSSVTS